MSSNGFDEASFHAHSQSSCPKLIVITWTLKSGGKLEVNGKTLKHWRHWANGLKLGRVMREEPWM